MAKQKLKQKELKDVNGGVDPCFSKKDKAHHAFVGKDSVPFILLGKDELNVSQLRKEESKLEELDAYLKPEEKKSFFNNILEVFKNFFSAKYK